MFHYDAAGDLRMIDHGRIEHPTSAAFEKHVHTDHELLLFVSGDADYVIDGNAYHMCPYDLILVPAATYHFLRPHSDAPYENYVINFSPKLCRGESLSRLFTPPYIFDASSDTRLKRMFAQFDFTFDRYSREDFAEASHCLLKEILLYLAYLPKAVPVADEDSLIMRITGYVVTHLEDELDASVIARQLNFSKSYVQNLFSAAMGIGLKQYIHQKKMYAARADIEAGLSPNRAAEKYGYGNYSSFFRSYVRVFGQSPNRAREK